QPFDDGRRILAAQHDYDTFDNVIRFVKTYLAESRFVRYDDIGDIFNQNRCRAFQLYGDITNIFQFIQQADPPHNVGLVALLDHIAAHVDIRFGHRFVHVQRRQVIILKFSGVNTDLIDLLFTAKTYDVRYAGHPKQFPLNNPILNSCNFFQGQVATDYVSKDLTRSARWGLDGSFGAFRQIYPRQLVGHILLCIEIVDIVFKLHRYNRKSKQGDRTDVTFSRN